MEANGQGSQPVRQQANEPQELSPVYSGHSPGHVPAPQKDIQELRGQHSLPERK